MSVTPGSVIVVVVCPMVVVTDVCPIKEGVRRLTTIAADMKFTPELYAKWGVEEKIVDVIRRLHQNPPARSPWSGFWGLLHQLRLRRTLTTNPTNAPSDPYAAALKGANISNTVASEASTVTVSTQAGQSEKTNGVLSLQTCGAK